MNEQTVLIVIPCLNEIKHITSLLDYLSDLKNSEMVVVDGGSTDGTQEAVLQANASVKLLNNPKKIQSAGVNLAIKKYGKNAKFFLRLDAHSLYPENFVNDLLEEAIATQAASIVVSMRTISELPMQQVIAVAQNSILGNGRSAHRNDNTVGKWIDHGHHALMLIDAFQQIGGYDESFVANEDAELDFRLTQAGYKIWLTAKTNIFYYPRKSLKDLFMQYYRFGLGRASNMLKHRQRPKVRQMIPLTILPMILLTFLSPVHWSFLLPFSVWALVCLGFGCWQAVKNKKIRFVLSGLAAATMHVGWSMGFFRKVFSF